MINETNIEKAKKQIGSSKEKPIIVIAKDDDFNRKILEFGKFDVLLFSEEELRKNKLKQINSGLNDFIACLAEKKNITIGFDLNDLMNLSSKVKAEIIAKIRQNMKICSKNDVKIKIFGFRDEKDAFSLLLSLGIDNKKAKEAISF